jgi:hypothetical protein
MTGAFHFDVRKLEGESCGELEDAGKSVRTNFLQGPIIPRARDPVPAA